MNYKKISFLKLFLLVIALWFAVFLVFVQRWSDIGPEHKLVFVLDISRTMNVDDVFSGKEKISRLVAAKQIIQTILFSEPGFSYGLIIFNGWVDYIIPPTLDTWTFLLYLSWITSNLLPHGDKDFSVLSGVMMDSDDTSYILISDFDSELSAVKLPDSTLLLGIGSREGDVVRYSNGVRYYDSGASVSSIRNDIFATSLWLPYTTLTAVEDFCSQQLIYGGFHLPLSQRILLYVVLGVIVILAIML